MSKKIIEIESEFNNESNLAKSAIGSGELDTLKISSFPNVEQIQYRYKIYNSGYETGETIVTKYQYNGGMEHNTRASANSERNSDIQSKIDILNARISKCETYMSKMENIYSDCEKSIENLEKDTEEVNRQISRIAQVKSSISSAKSYYSRARDSIQNCYNCSPYALNLEIGNAINYIQNQECSIESNGLSSVSDTLNRYIEQGNQVIRAITEVKVKILEKKFKLIVQRNLFNSMKR